MTAANDLGLTTAVPARSTIYADTYPRTIAIEVSAGDLQATRPVIYKLDFKRISAKTAFWAGRPAMRVIQALTWFRGDQSSLDASVNGIVRHLSRDPNRRIVAQDLHDNIHAVPHGCTHWSRGSPASSSPRIKAKASRTRAREGDHAEDVH